MFKTIQHVKSKIINASETDGPTSQSSDSFPSFPKPIDAA